MTEFDMYKRQKDAIVAKESASTIVQCLDGLDRIATDGLILAKHQLENKDAEIKRLQGELEAAKLDVDRVNRMADGRIVDGIAGIDIDEETSYALDGDSTEEQWKAEWRVQFRKAIDAAYPAQ